LTRFICFAEVDGTCGNMFVLICGPPSYLGFTTKF